MKKHPVVEPDFDPAIRLTGKTDGFYLEIRFDQAWGDGGNAQTGDHRIAGKGNHSRSSI